MTATFHEADDPSIYRLGDGRIGEGLGITPVGSQHVPWGKWVACSMLIVEMTIKKQLATIVYLFYARVQDSQIPYFISTDEYLI